MANASLFPRPVCPPVCRPLPLPLTADAPARARRRIDGADVAAKRRKTSAGDDPIGEEDVSLERYEYAAPSAILSSDGACGFAITCAFNREKSATKEAWSSYVPTSRTPGRRPARTPPQPRQDPGPRLYLHTTLPSPVAERRRADVAEEAAAAAAAASAAVASAALPAVAALANAVRAGERAAPRWVEKSFPYR